MLKQWHGGIDYTDASVILAHDRHTGLCMTVRCSQVLSGSRHALPPPLNNTSSSTRPPWFRLGRLPKKNYRRGNGLL